MTGQQTPDSTGLRLCPPPSKDFDPFTASQADLIRHGLPLRPDPHSQPGMAALWERQARRYRHFDHLEPRPDTATAAKKAVSAPVLGPGPLSSCGYQLSSSSAPFTALFVTWTVPDLWYSPGQFDPINHFQTFVGLGFLDVHVEMTVDPQETVAVSALYLRARKAAEATIPMTAHTDDEVRRWIAERVVRHTDLWVAEDDGGALVGLLVLDDLVAGKYEEIPRPAGSPLGNSVACN